MSRLDIRGLLSRDEIGPFLDKYSPTATAILIATAIVGPALPVFSVSSNNVFLFRVVAPMYAVIVIWSFYTGWLDISRIPIACWLLIAFGTWAAISTLWAASLGTAMSTLSVVLLGIVLVVGITVTTTGEVELSHYTSVVILLGVVALLTAFWEISTGGHLSTSRLSTAAYANVDSPIGVDVASAWYLNRNNLAFFLVLLVGPLAALAFNSNHWTSLRTGSVIGIGTVAIVSWVNGARVVLVSIVIAIVSVVALQAARPFYNRYGPPRYGRTLVIAAVFLAGATAVAVFAVVPNPFSDPWRSMWIRWDLSAKAIDLAIDSKLLGIGAGSFTVLVEPAGGPGITTPHNWLLYLLAEFGVIGVSLVLLAYGMVIYDLAEITLRTGSSVRAGLFGAMIALPVASLGPSNAVLTQEFWLFFGLAIAAAYQA